jgi:hypothetical protein
MGRTSPVTLAMDLHGYVMRVGIRKHGMSPQKSIWRTGGWLDSGTGRQTTPSPAQRGAVFSRAYQGHQHWETHVTEHAARVRLHVTDVVVWTGPSPGAGGCQR